MHEVPVSGRAAPAIFTIGHSNRSLGDFLALLTDAGVTCVLDVRRLPGSRAYPHYDADALREALAEAGIDYVHMAALGGRRGRSLPKEDMRNAMWRNASFRRYADYASTDDFAGGFEQLQARARRQRCAVMCAEALWWRCHRRIIADHLLARGWQVWHIMGPGKLMPATLTPGAQVAGDEVTYPA